jgi:hypothetical protein
MPTVAFDSVAGGNYPTARAPHSEALTRTEQQTEQLSAQSKDTQHARSETLSSGVGDRSPNIAIENMKASESSANPNIGAMLNGVSIGGMEPPGAGAPRNSQPEGWQQGIEPTHMQSAGAGGGGGGGGGGGEWQHDRTLTPMESGGGAGGAGGGGVRVVGEGQGLETKTGQILDSSNSMQRSEAGKTSNSSDYSADKIKEISTAGSDASLTNVVPKLETFSPEQIRTLPLEQLQQSVEKNQQQLIACVQDNYSKLPDSVGAHGGTAESNAIWLASGGEKMVPEGAKSGNREDRIWMWASPNKPADPSHYAADLARSVGNAVSYAAPAWVKESYTPGGVGLVDIAAEVSRYSRFWNSGLDGNNSKFNTVHVTGLGTSENARANFLSAPKKAFDTGYKGMIDISQINQFNSVIDELNKTPGQEDRGEVAQALRNQTMLSEALKVLLNKPGNYSSGELAPEQKNDASASGGDALGVEQAKPQGYDIGQSTDDIVDWANFDKWLSSSKRSQ